MGRGIGPELWVTVTLERRYGAKLDGARAEELMVRDCLVGGELLSSPVKSTTSQGRLALGGTMVNVELGSEDRQIAGRAA